MLALMDTPFPPAAGPSVWRAKMGVKAALPRYELYLYTAVLGVAMVWAASWIVEASSGEWETTGHWFTPQQRSRSIQIRIRIKVSIHVECRFGSRVKFGFRSTHGNVLPDSVWLDLDCLIQVSIIVTLNPPHRDNLKETASMLNTPQANKRGATDKLEEEQTKDQEQQTDAIWM